MGNETAQVRFLVFFFFFFSSFFFVCVCVEMKGLFIFATSRYESSCFSKIKKTRRTEVIE